MNRIGGVPVVISIGDSYQFAPVIGTTLLDGRPDDGSGLLDFPGTSHHCS